MPFLVFEHSMMIIRRLVIRHTEDQLGLGAEMQGMPMTGRPVSFAAISMLNFWVDSEYLNLRKNSVIKNSKKINGR